LYVTASPKASSQASVSCEMGRSSTAHKQSRARINQLTALEHFKVQEAMLSLGSRG